MNIRPLKAGDIHPGEVLRDVYGMNATNRPIINVNEQDVPVPLRPLIPYTERWAIPCDVTRHDYFRYQPEADIAEFWQSVLPHTDAIHDWLDSLGDVRGWPKAAVHFMYLLKAHSEAYQPTEEEIAAARARRAAWQHERDREQSIQRATEAFRRKDYFTTVNELAPFEAELDEITSARLAFARKKAGQSPS